ncbi:MAG: DNA replication/repair protein RecF [Nevskiales bacterium]|nr:DNA replication/repair protein RecF [Nevskiales bacterium]
MYLSRAVGENFRLFERLEWKPHPRLNLILGPNASGKTSVLEAIYLLGRGRSFRGALNEAAGRLGPQWRIRGEIARHRDSAPGSVIHTAWSGQGLEVRVDQAPVVTHELVRRFPVQILEPDSHRLIEEAPANRRRYLDWGVFHVEHQFFHAWRRYQRALRQRNQALRSARKKAEVEAWNVELATAGEEIQGLREAHLELLRDSLGREIHRLLNETEWSLDLARGWPARRSLVEALAEHYPQDQRLGKTMTGPHKAELKLKLSGKTARHHVSRGQQKLLIAALLLAQARIIAEHAQAPPVLLVDDFCSELGPGYQQALMAALEDYPGQTFITAIESSAALEKVQKSAVFHVEQGTENVAMLV